MSGRRLSAIAGRTTGLLTQPHGYRGSCSSCCRRRGRPSAACCSASCLSSLVRTDAVFQSRTDGGPALVLVGVHGPSSGFIPEQAACCHRHSSLSSTSEVTALLQGEEDGRPGTVVLSNPAVRQG